MFLLLLCSVVLEVLVNRVIRKDERKLLLFVDYINVVLENLGELSVKYCNRGERLV